MRLRVATFNVYVGADLALLFGAVSAEDLAGRAAVVLDQLRRNDVAARADAVAGLLVRERVDVVGLQELARWTLRPGDDAAAAGTPAESGEVVDFLDRLLEALQSAGTPYDVHGLGVSFVGALSIGGGQFGVTGHNAVLVRRGGPARVVTERGAPFATTLDVPTALTGVHFPVRRSWATVELDVGGISVLVANTHTEAYDPAVRDAQRDELLDRLDEHVGPAVLLGDLNATPDRVRVPEPWADAWIAAGCDPDGGATCGRSADLADRTAGLAVRIDYVFVRGLAVRDSRRLGVDPADRTATGLWPSDHAGVLAELDLPDRTDLPDLPDVPAVTVAPAR